MSDVDAAREWANERCAALARRSAGASGKKGPVHYALVNALAIGRVLNEHGHPTAYTVSEETADYLYFRSFTCADTYDIATRVVARNISEGVELPVPLRAFASLVITGALRRPTQRGRRRADNWERDREILELLDTLVTDFEINPTRSDETRRSDSACDLVAAGFAAAGQKMLTYQAVKAIWHNARLQGELRAIRNLLGARAHDAPAFVMRCESPFDVSEN